MDRLMTITADNAGNNGTLLKAIQQAVKLFRTQNGLLTDHEHLVHIPCLAHVIQLALTALITDLKITAKNKRVITVWEDDPKDRETHSEKVSSKAGAPWTLKKVMS